MPPHLQKQGTAGKDLGRAIVRALLQDAPYCKLGSRGKGNRIADTDVETSAGRCFARRGTQDGEMGHILVEEGSDRRLHHRLITSCCTRPGSQTMPYADRFVPRHRDIEQDR